MLPVHGMMHMRGMMLMHGMMLTVFAEHGMILNGKHTGPQWRNVNSIVTL